MRSERDVVSLLSSIGSRGETGEEKGLNVRGETSVEIVANNSSLVYFSRLLKADSPIFHS